jgi:hypothetical protein
MARPMPRDEPVTTATFPLRSNSDTGLCLPLMYFAGQLIGRETTRQVEEETRDGSDQCRNRPDP